MRVLLPLLVACGGGSSPATPDAPAAPVHYVLDFTFGTNGEALVNTGAASVSAVNVVATASGLGMFAKTAGGGYICLTTPTGKLAGGACTMTDLDASAYGTLAADGGGVVAIDGSGALVHFGPAPSLAPAPSFAAKQVFAQTQDGVLSAGSRIVASDGAGRVAIDTGTVDLTAGLAGGPFAVTAIGWDDDLIAVGTAGDGHAFDVYGTGDPVAATRENRLDAAGAPTSVAIFGRTFVEVTTAGAQEINGDGTQFPDPVIYFPQLDGPSLAMFRAGPGYEAVAVVGTQIYTQDDLAMFDPLPADGHTPARFDVVVASGNGFIVAGASNGSIVLYRYVPQ